MPETPATTSGDGATLRLLDMSNESERDRLIEKLLEPRAQRWFWEDSLRPTDEQPQRAALAFLALFCAPSSLVVDLAGDGFLLFERIHEGWRANLHAYIWGPRAARKPALHRQAIASVMNLANLLVVEAQTADDNRACVAALKRTGFRYRGRIPQALCYNGERKDALWWEIDRAAVGLPPREGD